jgi:hypothetical protein
MTQANDRTSWRGSFVSTLNVLAQAAARLPVCALDPVLSGASAVELYTGGLWSTRDLELVCADARPLMTELFASGFRWVQRPRRSHRVLWHPELHVAVDLTEHSPAYGLAEPVNILVVAINLKEIGQVERESFSLKVVGIEDLIVQQVGGWLQDGASSEAAIKVQALAGLAREGVGGGLRTGYLQRRLASETDGEVVFDSLLKGEGSEPAAELRRISLTRMQTLIRAWRDRSGLSAVPRSWCSGSRMSMNSNPVRIARGRNENLQRGGRSDANIENVVALDDALPVPRD